MDRLPPHERAPGWVWRRAGGAILVMGPAGEAHQLDGAAAVVWLCLERAGSEREVVARGADLWPSAEDAAARAREGIRALAELGAVRVAGSAP